MSQVSVIGMIFPPYSSCLVNRGKRISFLTSLVAHFLKSGVSVQENYLSFLNRSWTLFLFRKNSQVYTYLLHIYYTYTEVGSLVQIGFSGFYILSLNVLQKGPQKKRGAILSLLLFLGFCFFSYFLARVHRESGDGWVLHLFVFEDTKITVCDSLC